VRHNNAPKSFPKSVMFWSRQKPDGAHLTLRGAAYYCTRGTVQLDSWYSSPMAKAAGATRSPQRDTRRPIPRDTRERLLEAAEAAVLAKGFASTSIEELIAAVGITKSGFFYHFKDKAELARGLMLRYLDHDRAVMDDIFTRGDATDPDPLNGFLAGLTLF